MSTYPQALEEIMELLEFLPEEERRGALINYSDGAVHQVPKEGEVYDLEDVRKDDECTDEVGIFLRVEEGNQAFFRVTLGPQVQTLTKAMTSILCKGLNGSTLQEIIDLPQDFVPRLVGGELVRVRSQTVYYVLGRMKGAAKVFLNRQRAEETA